jgi:hypothetical protein
VTQVADKKRHGCVQCDLWVQIVAALAGAGVELLSQGASFGAGVRWTAPRERQNEEAHPGGGRAKRPRFGTSRALGMMFRTMSGPAGPPEQELGGASARDGANGPDQDVAAGHGRVLLVLLHTRSSPTHFKRHSRTMLPRARVPLPNDGSSRAE